MPRMLMMPMSRMRVMGLFLVIAAVMKCGGLFVPPARGRDPPRILGHDAFLRNVTQNCDMRPGDISHPSTKLPAPTNEHATGLFAQGDTERRARACRLAFLQPVPNEEAACARDDEPRHQLAC
jgi:hypothetical protein